MIEENKNENESLKKASATNPIKKRKSILKRNSLKSKN